MNKKKLNLENFEKKCLRKNVTKLVRRSRFCIDDCFFKRYMVNNNKQKTNINSINNVLHCPPKQVEGDFFSV